MVEIHEAEGVNYGGKVENPWLFYFLTLLEKYSILTCRPERCNYRFCRFVLFLVFLIFFNRLPSRAY